MSCRFCAWIRIGGRIERTQVPELCKAITAANVSTEWGDATLEPHAAEDLLAALDEDHLWLCNDEADCGEFPDLELACRKLGLSFTRHSEAYLDCDAELVDFRPGMKQPLVRTGRNRGGDEALVSAALVWRALTALEAGRIEPALRRLRKLCPEIPPLPRFEIV